MSHPPNPALRIAIQQLHILRNTKDRLGKVVDLGCGKLRHYSQLSANSDSLYLVDTNDQIKKTHNDGNKRYTVLEMVERDRLRGKIVQALSFEDFIKQKIKMDTIFCIAVFDVVPRKTRQLITKAASPKLSRNGHFVIIVPRNDSSILRRCSNDNAYFDGHVFSHHGIHTFYHNFKDYKSIIRDCAAEDMVLVSDLSLYRQVCLIFSPKKSVK